MFEFVILSLQPSEGFGKDEGKSLFVRLHGGHLRIDASQSVLQFVDSLVLLCVETLQTVYVILFESDRLLQVLALCSRSALLISSLTEFALQIHILCLEVIEVSIHESDIFFLLGLSPRICFTQFCHLSSVLLFCLLDLYVLLSAFVLHLSHNAFFQGLITNALLVELTHGRQSLLNA